MGRCINTFKWLNRIYNYLILKKAKLCTVVSVHLYYCWLEELIAYFSHNNGNLISCSHTPCCCKFF